jgi:hypothetical protein
LEAKRIRLGKNLLKCPGEEKVVMVSLFLLPLNEHPWMSLDLWLVLS